MSKIDEVNRNNLVIGTNACENHDFERWEGKDFAKQYDILHCKNCGIQVIAEPVKPPQEVEE